MNKPKPKKPTQKTRALIVLNADGCVEVYGEPGLLVHVAQRLTVGSNASEILADELLDLAIPRAFKDLYWPVKLRATGLCERITIADEIARRAHLAIVRELGNMTAKNAPVPSAIAKARRAGK